MDKYQYYLRRLPSYLYFCDEYMCLCFDRNTYPLLLETAFSCFEFVTPNCVLRQLMNLPILGRVGHIIIYLALIL
jgi:hypothetical protein